MKKIIFGVSLIISGVIGVLTLLVMAFLSTNSLGTTINGSSNLFDFLSYWGMVPVFFIFAFIGIAGIVICVLEAYLNNK